MLPLAWAASRQGMAGAISAAIVLEAGVTIAALWPVLHLERMPNLQMLVLSLILSGFLIGIAVDIARRASDDLRHSMRLAAAGEMAAAGAHELNQPLAAISSYTAGALNVLERADKGVPVEPSLLRRALEQARQQAQRAGQIIRSVHEFVKKSEPQREEVAIKSVVDGVRALVELQARKAYVALQFELPAQLPTVLADRLMLEQVLLNLTRNGIEAMAEVPPERRLLRIAADADAAQVSVSVIDNGHGIPPDVAERLFSPFFSTKAEGMGMGLSICRTAIEFHGGTLTHAPNPGGGTVFTFSLPRRDAAAAASATGAPELK
ncbi:MAG TPA: hypothetical protein DDZ22_07975 [Massilia sp.]|nr:hypothetical protein [Massilia sp.]